MLKRFLCLVLVLVLLSMNTFASASGFWGNIGGLLDDALQSVGDAVDSVIDGVSDIADDVWDWTSTAAGDVWDWTSIAAGDVWNWTSDTAGTIWDWTTTAATDVWNWSSTFAVESWAWTEDTVTEITGSIGSWISMTGEGALEALHDVWNMLLTEAGIAGDKATAMWDMLMEYAEHYDIDPLSLAKLAISIAIKVIMSIIPGGSIGLDIAEELLGELVDWLFDHNIYSNSNADAALDNLEQSINEFLPEIN